MAQRIIGAALMGLAWMPLTAGTSFGSFAVGFILSFALLMVLFDGKESPQLALNRLPQQLIAAAQYSLILFRDIFLSAIDVAKRVVDPALPINPGIIAVSTQYTLNPEAETDNEAKADVIAALSAHGITITPGELVVDFDGNRLMYVHCLDVTASAAVAESNQAKRLSYLRRMLP